MQRKPLVTIFCLTYNHAPFIRKAFEGFLMQKTTFSFEIIVHDDASTDGTQEIIREYVQKYPTLFVPILQKENQYSQRINAFDKYVRPKVRGKYIAFCEGDDYWISSDKLQKQIDYMEAHPDCAMTGHNSYFLDDRERDHPKLYKKVVPYYENSVVTMERFLSDIFGKNNMTMTPTASRVIRFTCCFPEKSWQTRFSFGDMFFCFML